MCECECAIGMLYTFSAQPMINVLTLLNLPHGHKIASYSNNVATSSDMERIYSIFIVIFIFVESHSERQQGQRVAGGSGAGAANCAGEVRVVARRDGARHDQSSRERGALIFITRFKQIKSSIQNYTHISLMKCYWWSGYWVCSRGLNIRFTCPPPSLITLLYLVHTVHVLSERYDTRYHWYT